MTGANDPRHYPVLVESYEEAKKNQEIDVLTDISALKRDLVEAFHTLDMISNKKYDIFGARRTAYVDSAEWLKTQDDIASSEVGSLDAQKIRTAEYGVKR